MSPALATWIAATFGVEAIPVRELVLRDAHDPTIFAAARAASVVVTSKDYDFAELEERLGPPPQVIWLRCGNTSNVALREVLTREFPDAIARLEAREVLVEIGTTEVA